MDRARLGKRQVRRALSGLPDQLEGLAAAHRGFSTDGVIVPLAGGCQALIDGLNSDFELPGRRVFLRDRPRPHKRSGGRIVYELHGLCTTDGLLEVYARTAARAKPVALPTLLNTLLHEWIHHWDLVTLGTSVHCRGFYKRLDQIYRPAVEHLRAAGHARG